MVYLPWFAGGARTASKSDRSWLVLIDCRTRLFLPCDCLRGCSLSEDLESTKLGCRVFIVWALMMMAVRSDLASSFSRSSSFWTEVGHVIRKFCDRTRRGVLFGLVAPDWVVVPVYPVPELARLVIEFLIAWS